jgi:hypothetical protein
VPENLFLKRIYFCLNEKAWGYNSKIHKLRFADYVEDTRIYESCISVRKELFSNLSADFDCSQNEHAVNKAVFDSLTFTENQLIKQGRVPNLRSSKAKKYIAALLSDK